MAIKRYYSEADNTISNAFDTVLSQRGTGSNAGANDVLETFSIYGQYTTSSSELSRILIKFPVTGTTSIKTDRDASDIPASGSVKFYLKMFNARHQEQIPENLTLSIFPVARDWEEGTGIDLVNRADKTKDVIPGSNWINRTKGVAWARNGGDYISSSADSAIWYTASFVTGSEDLEVDVTDLVEEWISSTAVKATATITFTEKPHEATTITLVDGDGTSATFEIDDNEDGVVAGNIAMNPASDDAAGMATILFQKVNASALKITATNPSSGQVVLTQDTAGRIGNTTITYSNSTSWSDNTSGTLPTVFTGGAGVTNYGFGIMVTSSQEAYFSGSTGDSGSELQNTGGITKSMYTKRFFARSSEFFFRRPIIEARWEDRITDDRNKFYASSSAIANNVNNLYLYNYVNGTLADFATDGAGLPSVNLYASSASAPSGSTLTDANCTKVSTGIYKAALTLATSESVLHDVWFLPGAVAIHTGTISVLTRSFSDSNDIGQYTSNITNLNDKYKRTENPRLRVFTRKRNACPTVYTVATSVAEGETIVSASYSVIRTVDEKVLFPHSSGSSVRHTYLSYDNSGSYFDFDMSLLEAGYMYGFKLAYYVAGAWQEQEEVFKFRVE
jgi:hypothetical protein